MALYKVYISEPAESDLFDIIRYISAQLHSPMTALKMMETIETALAESANMPQKYPLVADDRLASFGYHKLLIKHYIAFFTIDENTKSINVERILYARRDWLYIL